MKPLKSSLHFFNCVEAALSGSLRENGLPEGKNRVRAFRTHATAQATLATRAVIILRIQIFRDIHLENILILEIQALFYFYISLRLKSIR